MVPEYFSLDSSKLFFQTGSNFWNYETFWNSGFALAHFSCQCSSLIATADIFTTTYSY